jgi:uncharacterized protein YndB with AHSA1/START domain
MRQVTAETHISAPREEIFDFVADLAGRPAYTDHYLEDYRLARVKSSGPGAAARFRLGAPFAKEYAELEVRELERPRRIVEEVKWGRRGRSRAVAVYGFIRESGGETQVELTIYSEPTTLADSLKEIVAVRWLGRRTRMALDRLRMIFEEPPGKPLLRATIAGYEPQKAARFGAHTGADPAKSA